MIIQFCSIVCLHCSNLLDISPLVEASFEIWSPDHFLNIPRDDRASKIIIGKLPAPRPNLEVQIGRRGD